MTTRQSLGIFWDGEETDGFTVYAYWPEEGTRSAPPELDAHVGLEVRTSQLGGDGWTVSVWDIRVQEWPSPSEWRDFVRDMLSQAIRSGAVVSWCAVEGAFADPPELFEPAQMSDGVWAALTSDGIQYGPPALDGPFEPLTNEQLCRLRDQVVDSRLRGLSMGSNQG